MSWVVWGEGILFRVLSDRYVNDKPGSFFLGEASMRNEDASMRTLVGELFCKDGNRLKLYLVWPGVQGFHNFLAFLFVICFEVYDIRNQF